MGSIAAPVQNAAHNIIDIRSDAAGIELQHQIVVGLKPEAGHEKTLPTLLLYDEQGLKLFERITYLEEYYLTSEELSVLKKDAASIAGRIPDGAMVIELGSGNLRKIKLVLDALEQARKHVHYYALDLMESELARTLAQVPSYEHVKCSGLHGTYDDGLAWLQRHENAVNPKVIMSIGSSIGNFTRSDAARFLKRFAQALNPSDAFLLIGVDACQEPDRVYRAYNDSEGITHEFTLNGLKHANRLLGSEVFRPADWDAEGEYDIQGGRHRAYVVPNKDLTVLGIHLRRGERIRIEESYKYNQAQAKQLWRESDVLEIDAWANQKGNYALHFLKPTKMFPTKPEVYAKHPVPSLEDWHQLWSTWDLVTRQMIPEEELLSKPIKLRNACIFYLGHIPTFFDMKLTEATGQPLTEPEYFSQIFERGIDPDVDNPEQCHAHSEIPNDWPALEEILGHQQRVRQRVTRLYESGEAYEVPRSGRALWLGYEHEIMHLETLLYMLLQSDWTRAPAVRPKPDFERLAADAHSAAVANQWFDIPAQTVDIGLDDPDTSDGPMRHFGWDVEKPVRKARVGAFKAQARPVTNGEYARYMQATGTSRLPASWTSVATLNGVNGHMNGNSDLYDFVSDKAVRTMYGPVPLRYALDWPLSASFDELNGCAKYMGGRIPTLEEARSIYQYAEALKKVEAERANSKTIPAVNGHLSNEGVQESPPHRHAVDGSASGAASLDPTQVFVNLDEANVGFKNWHPVPITPFGNKLAGQGDMGGLWEWTSSPLTKQDGFQPMKLYPAYSVDFYDGKHNVVLGGSWATHPRVAGRKSFVNWYQRNYPHPATDFLPSAPQQQRLSQKLDQQVAIKTEETGQTKSPRLNKMPNDIYRWQEGGGLVHHCPICEQPLTNPNSRTKCLGQHVEWCKRYHTQLFKKGSSSECAPCRKSDEQHIKRHRDIAELLRQLDDLQNQNAEPQTSKTIAERRQSTPYIPSPLSKKERKAANKAMKHAANRPKVLTTAQVDFVEHALHPQNDDVDEAVREAELLEDPDIKLNMYFHKGTSNSREVRHRHLTRKNSSQSHEEDEVELDTAMSALNVPKPENVKTEAQRKIIAVIRTAVKEDLMTLQRETEETGMRKAGFWRWASRKAYNRLVAHGRIWADKTEQPDVTRRKDSAASAPEESSEVSDQGSEPHEGTGMETDTEPSTKSAKAVALPPVVPATDLSDGRLATTPKAATLSVTTSPKSSTTPAAGNPWTTVGKVKTPKTPAGTFKLKLSTNGGLSQFHAAPKTKTLGSLGSDFRDAGQDH
ncbi:Histidine-specific methyltransferase, SAM-dependent [Teratosphaeria destructans]|uniref:Histidine-specific methyltransferase, SAM-dependent n=1 Tax=Teratosphaeria destructans TaxID=418781 RepID=A0A9W7SKS3_9PEZI|nr:Histidine-specific methyltransferase, SAM-dependent [Teratosphaeria destructans]